MQSGNSNLSSRNDLLEPPNPFAAFRGALILWLIAIGLIVFFVPLVLINSTMQKDTETLRGEFLVITQSLTLVPTPEPTVQELMDELNLVQQAFANVRAAYPTIAAGYTDWRSVMAAVGNYDLNQINLNSVKQQGRRLTLVGRALNDAAVVAYAGSLENSDQFARVVVQSIKVVATPFVPASALLPTPTASPVSPTPVPSETPQTPTPGPSPSATPDLRDNFEEDDSEPGYIFLAEPQHHNFYPLYDVDSVKFLAKTDRFYRAYTTDLSPGVDTFLSVTLGDKVYTNDDSSVGTLNSLIEFKVEMGYDLEALVRVTNRGQYGAERWYDLIVEEVVATATPTEVSATKTPKPDTTATKVPTQTPTATPDPRDPYESDDVTPRLMAIGEIQSHNFYPQDDIDKTSFVAKSNRNYQILTSGLALGVDTYLLATLGGNQWENDDYAPPGSGNFASGLCLRATSSGNVIVTISNVQKQYGAEKSYQIGVKEAPVLSVEPLSLAFGPVLAGGADPADQVIQIGSTGGTTMTWEAETSANWLSVSPANGTTPTKADVSMDIDGLASGNYQASIVISSTSVCAQNIPQTVTVSLEVSEGASRIAGVALLAPSLMGFGEETSSTSTLAPDLALMEWQAGNTLAGADAVEFIIVLDLKVASL